MCCRLTERFCCYNLRIAALVAGILQIPTAAVYLTATLVIKNFMGFFHWINVITPAAMVAINAVLLPIGIYANLKPVIMTWLVIDMLCLLVCMYEFRAVITNYKFVPFYRLMLDILFTEV